MTSVPNGNFNKSNSTISNNIIINTSSAFGMYFTNDGGQNKIYDNSFTLSPIGVKLLNSSNAIMKDNNMDGSRVVGGNNEGYIIDSSSNITINGGELKNLDIGMEILDSSFITINLTLIKNMTFNNDNFDVGLRISNSTNVNIYNVNTSEIATAPLYIQGSSNIIVNNFTAGLISLHDRAGYQADDIFDFPCAIKVVEEYKSYLGENHESGGRNITYLSEFKSHNISLSNINFFNSQCLLHLQGAINLTHDLIGFRSISYQTPTFLLDKTEILMNKDYNNLSRYRSGLFNWFLAGYNGTFYTNITLTQNYNRFANINTSTNLQTNIYNLTNALIYFNNNSVACANVNSCDNNINITLSPQNYSYVLDNYNKTEGESRPYDPIWFSSSTNTEKHIASNLTNNVNVDVTINFDSSKKCNDIKEISYTPKGNSATNPAYACDETAHTLKFTSLQINPSSTSNVLVITYYLEGMPTLCNNFGSGIGSFGGQIKVVLIILGVVLTLAIISIAVFVVIRIKNGEGFGMIEELPIKNIGFIIIGFFIFIVLVFGALFATDIICAITT